MSTIEEIQKFGKLMYPKWNEIFTIFCGCVLRDASHGAVTRFSVKHYCTYGYKNVMRQ